MKYSRCEKIIRLLTIFMLLIAVNESFAVLQPVNKGACVVDNAIQSTTM